MFSLSPQLLVFTLYAEKSPYDFEDIRVSPHFIAELESQKGHLVNIMDVRNRISLFTLVVFKVRGLAKSVYRYSLPLHEQSLRIYEGL